MADQEKMKILKKFIENEIANSNDQYELSTKEMQAIFENSIKAIEEVSNEEIDIDKFNEFLKYYKVMKLVEKLAEEVRVDKYLKDVKVK